MEFSELRQQLESAIITNPGLSKISVDDHWLYVPEKVREAILLAHQQLGDEAVAKITKQDVETIEKWLQEDDIVNKLREKVIRYNSTKDPSHPYARTIKPDVCKLARVTTCWTAAKALDIFICLTRQVRLFLRTSLNPPNKKLPQL